MTTHSVSGGAQALEVLAADGPPAAGFDLALLDFSMPEMNGLELARRLRAEGRPGLPLILLTASGDQVAAARAAGVTGFATKPVRQEKLRKLLVATLSGADGVPSTEAEANLGRPGQGLNPPRLTPTLLACWSSRTTPSSKPWRSSGSSASASRRRLRQTGRSRWWLSSDAGTRLC
jgi:CheY-like chemotaxis protein